MSTYFVGDVHGCYKELRSLLQKVKFDSNQDELWLSGDLVSKGPDSLDVLQYVFSLGKSAKVVLGNHDLNLLLIHAGLRKNSKKDNLTELLKSKDADHLINWLRKQPLLRIDEKRKILLSHAGISPQWNIKTAKKCAKECELMLKKKNYFNILNSIRGDYPNFWKKELVGTFRFRFSVNVLTRMRYCFPDGSLELNCKENPSLVKKEIKPWYEIKNLSISKKYKVFFGHWSTLVGTQTPNWVVPLDTGCCWGRGLTMIRLEDQKKFVQY
ncbi:symmetrical bis(5'-nucleosyl)-tetraphosphatase [Buchnera aphidicola (Mindarus keteleerifoliae)]|uniref:symmetrical bis(5'-nucleosyl)-tetraphosphatase n=1 Tax=Buchnera aphidicola TaxID=9 RepID=UPI0031B72C43